MDEQVYSFLLIGQSNMAGRGYMNEVEPIKNENLYVLRNGRWVQMFAPLHWERRMAGICLAESFGEQCVKTYRRKIGLIPCADGGSCLDQWVPGDVLFDHAVFQAKLAMRSSTLAGVLWHQGEADCMPERYPLYEEKCTAIFEAFRRELGLSDEVPFLVGGLGEFLKDRKESPFLVNYPHVNAHLQSMAAHQPYIHFVPAEGIPSNPDNLHFSAAGLREFGNRYFEVFAGQNRIIPVCETTGAALEMTEMEKL